MTVRPSTLRFSANLSMMFTEAPFLERFELAKRHGFDAVEFWFPYEWSAQEVAQRLNDHGLRCTGINTPAGEVHKGDWGVTIDPGREDDFKRGLTMAYEYAVALDCPAVHVMAGVVKPGLAHALARQTYERRLAQACDVAASLGKAVLIEPLNPVDRPGYFMSSQALAREVIDAVAKPNLKVMFDLYHAQMTEGRLIDNLRLHGSRIGHIQLADVPGRHEPGTGEVNWERVFEAIEASGYRGYIGCEYKPKAGTVAGLGWRDHWQSGFKTG